MAASSSPRFPAVPHIVLVATGGTIASRPAADGAVTTALSGSELLDSVAGVDTIDVDVVDLACAHSWNHEPTFMAEVAATCRRLLTDEGASGVVVTHGTDTLEETAWLTELLAGSATVDGPIVFTAAMRNAAELSADGPANLRDALTVARDPEAAGRGVLLCVNGDLHHARWVVKTDAHALDTFRSPAAGPVGRIDAGRVTFTITPPAAPAAAPPGPEDRLIEPEVALVKAYGGITPDVIDFFVDRGARGLVVEGTGAGNVYGGLVDGITRAIAAGLPVVVTSRCLTGAVLPIYGGDGGGARLAELGVIPGRDLGSVKARLALMVALARNPGLDAVRAWFDLLG
jgi:L-asparaginase